MTAGLIISAPHSGAGKTSVAVGLMAALSTLGKQVQPFKCGPDYIDPGFHAAASHRASFNLDAFAMSAAEIAAVHALSSPHDLVICEGGMGLFDSGIKKGSGAGATADIAAQTGWPVVLVLDIRRMAQTAGAMALGCKMFRGDISIAGVILNRASGDRHAALARAGVEEAGLPVLGVIPEGALAELPSRHLGLVQAGETAALHVLIGQLAKSVMQHVDLEALMQAAGGGRLSYVQPLRIKPPGQRIALARDDAFSFIYPHLTAAWRNAGATILPFSPLADQSPDETADALWLPGGYPELHAGRLAQAQGFRASVRRFAQSRPVHGECGGYMVLGEGLVDKEGTRHPMLGLLAVETSFAKRRLQLGYRRARLMCPAAGHGKDTCLIGHEFHYATITRQDEEPLASVTDAAGDVLAETGSRRGPVTGTFFHMMATDDGEQP